MPQQFVIPQFIDNEDHIIGPVTTRQFVLLMVAGFLLFVAYKLSDFVLFIIEAIIICVLVGVLAFVKVNGRPFHFFLLNLVQTWSRASLRVWNKRASVTVTTHAVRAAPTPTVVKRVAPGSSRLSELALVVDTGGVYRGEEQNS